MFWNKKERKPNEYVFGVNYFAEWSKGGGNDPEDWTIYRISDLYEIFYTDSRESAKVLVDFFDARMVPAKK